MKLTLIKFPMPPSVNNARGSFYNKKAGRMTHYQSTDLKNFLRDAQAYIARDEFRWKKIRQQLKRSMGWKDFLVVYYDFYFPIEKIVADSSRFLKLDTSNRIKAVEDALSKYAVGVDDSRFDVGSARKRPLRSSKLSYVNIKIEVQRFDSHPEIHPREESEVPQLFKI